MGHTARIGAPRADRAVDITWTAAVAAGAERAGVARTGIASAGIAVAAGIVVEAKVVRAESGIVAAGATLAVAGRAAESDPGAEESDRPVPTRPKRRARAASTRTAALALILVTITTTTSRATVTRQIICASDSHLGEDGWHKGCPASAALTAHDAHKELGSVRQIVQADVRLCAVHGHVKAVVADTVH